MDSPGLYLSRGSSRGPRDPVPGERPDSSVTGSMRTLGSAVNKTGKRTAAKGKTARAAVSSLWYLFDSPGELSLVFDETFRADPGGGSLWFRGRRNESVAAGGKRFRRVVNRSIGDVAFRIILRHWMFADLRLTNLTMVVRPIRSELSPTPEFENRATERFAETVHIAHSQLASAAE